MIDYGMRTAKGNKVISDLIAYAKKKKLPLEDVWYLLQEISEIPGYKDAAKRKVWDAVFEKLTYLLYSCNKY